MRKPIALAAAMLACSAPALADEPLKSVDSFEAEVRKCLLESKAPADCLDGVLRGHFSPGNEKLNEIVPQVVSLFRQWLGKDAVFAMHPVKSRKVGDYFEERVYLVEDATGSVMMLETAFYCRLGKWYLHRFNLSSKKEDIREALGIGL